MAMANLYYKRVKAGIMKLNEVPTKWKNDVQTMIESETGE